MVIQLKIKKNIPNWLLKTNTLEIAVCQMIAVCQLETYAQTAVRNVFKFLETKVESGLD